MEFLILWEDFFGVHKLPARNTENKNIIRKKWKIKTVICEHQKKMQSIKQEERIMSLFTRMAEGAGVGGVLGTAIGALVGGAATTAAVAFTAPVSIPVMFATGAVVVGTTLTAAEFGGAVGTLTGAGAGAVADVVDKKRR